MKTYFIALLLLVSLTASSQTDFQKITFAEALNQSQKAGRLILLQLESINCEMCNYAADRAFADKAVSDVVVDQFIALKISPNHSDRNLINTLYDLNNTSYATLFVNGNKDLIHRFDGTTSFTKTYLDQFNIAQYNNGEVIKLSIYEEAYRKNRTTDNMERWIWARNSLKLKSDSLLDFYVEDVAPEFLNSDWVLDFIIRQAPSLDSEADLVVRNSGSFNKIWDRIALSERIAINRKIIAKSMSKAIEEQNERYAVKVASFASATYNNDVKAATNNFNLQLLKYYEGVVAIDKYINFGKKYFDNSLLQTTPEELLRKDSLRRIELIKNAKKEEVKDGNVFIQKASITFSPSGQKYTNALNQAAWFIYKNTTNKTYLEKALEWSSKANEYSVSFESIGTEARILYKLGKKKEAIELMEKAINIKNERIKIPTAFSSLDAVLKNMKEDKDVLEVN